MQPILEIEHMSIRFTQYAKGMQRRELPVIKDLSLKIAPGQIVAVVGASGSGKSLLAHGILHILPHNSHMEGRVVYDGSELTPRRAAKLRGREIVLVPQGVTYLDPLMKVGDQVRGDDAAPDAKQRARKALARYGLAPETEELYPFELSGGMARRVLIAAAVARSPRLIIADEPTPGLDAKAAARILGHFRELAEGGAGVLLITHDLELALTISDQVAVFYAGQTIEVASAADFADSANLRHPFTRALWGAMPEHGFQPIEGAQPYPGTMAAGCPFAGQCARSTPRCRDTAELPLRPWRGGMVRCLNPQTEE